MKYFYSTLFLVLIHTLGLAQRTDKSSIELLRSNTTTYPTTNMVKISRKKIPEELRFTLMNVSYVGWEKGLIYLDTATNDYVVIIPDKYKTPGAKDSSAFIFSEDVVWHCFTSEGRSFPCSTDESKKYEKTVQ